ncbi:molybdopterin converting factor subunit 1 [Oceanobacillus alkalisoli]|uniref:molybdopterin converting factor subunit 1 n=1 Tax=Oceanobacillus alkalisoli TaxID=2925113 RepID=UPI001EEF9E43|nr:molybdopterin converting factor subunit 1 [Oceanobacillus alkalisoli]MCF3942139.1 molybdopterin converting factor subunit 1 [Oceanobacillus alkalisoli]MCG5104373.1 molybdopterin converting factor subunit 1 [Oceanobacillus alkalisoli]
MIKVLLFAELQETAGKTSLNIPLENVNVEQLKERLQTDYPQLNLSGVMTAINEEYAKEEDAIMSGDTVAFIPPVSGG